MIEIKLHKYFTSLSLSSDQSDAIDSLESFFNSNEQIFLLKGYAGTGKTTLLSGVIKGLKENLIETYLMAPTGRAAFIMQEKTHTQASTIHKIIYNFNDLVEDKDSDHFRAYYNLNTNDHSENTIYFIDEASMISDVFSENEFFSCGSGFLLKDLINFSNLKSSKRKIVFIGDPAQLPPVGMNFSPALSIESIQSYNLSVSEIILRSVYRQAEQSDILSTASNFRKCIEEEKFNAFELEVVNGDVKILDFDAFEDRYFSLASKTKDGIDKIIVIAHANKQTLNYNYLIRKMRFGGAPDLTVQKREKLLVTKNSYAGHFPIFNGTIITVLDVYDSIRKETIPFNGRNGTKHVETIIWRDIRARVWTINGFVDIDTTIVENVLHEPSTSLSQYQQLAIYVDFKNRMAKNEIRPGTDDYKFKYRSDKYLNALRVKFGYAITCHKAQGGEWENVIVDFDTFIGDKTKTYFRWAYTAVTRGKSTITAINPNVRNALSEIVFSEIEILTKPIPGNWFYPNPHKEDKGFLNWQKDRLQVICTNADVDIEIKEFPYRRRLKFKKDSFNCTIDLQYNGKFFTKHNIVGAAVEVFAETCMKFTSNSYESDEFEFKSTEDHKVQLFDTISDIADSLNINIVNVKHNDFSELYFFNTIAMCSVIEFYFDGNDIYGKAIPKSTLGKEDELLNNLILQLS